MRFDTAGVVKKRKPVWTETRPAGDVAWRYTSTTTFSRKETVNDNE